MPHVEPGQRVGLFGGSFNPPHNGHVHVSEQSLRKLELSQIWWLVSPGNPLKDQSILAPLARRIADCEAVTSNPRIKVTACELRFATRFTADTLAHIVTRNPLVDFVWIMGADNLGQLHLWERWRTIADTMPIAVIDRPGSTLALHSAKAAHALRRYRIDENDASLLPSCRAPAWVFLHGPRNSLSSTTIRSGSLQTGK